MQFSTGDFLQILKQILLSIENLIRLEHPKINHAPDRTDQNTTPAPRHH